MAGSVNLNSRARVLEKNRSLCLDLSQYDFKSKFAYIFFDNTSPYIIAA